MEVNPNPAWSSAAKLAVMARHAGMGYADLLRMILDTAWARLASGLTPHSYSRLSTKPGVSRTR